ECLNYALSRPEKYGVWGGLNEEERAAERRRRMRRANAA
ncbi:MAG TPA: WhiB family transcriptional regulator, partial [Sporichthyaceae bacterium]|nr:WhiB family transcriptional regulator [Sporichthyaceae bacterium]